MSLVGQKIPDTQFMHVPWTEELASASACGVPQKYSTHERFAGKKVAIVAVPGAYTPTCHANHIPAFVKHANDFASKGYQVIILAANDPFVMSGWRTSLGAKDEIEFATDLGLEFSKALNATADLSSMGFGMRTGRYAAVIDDLKLVSLDVEPNPGAVDVSSAEKVLGRL